MCAQKRWRRIRGFDHLAKAIAGVKYKDGVEMKQTTEGRSAVAYTRLDDSSAMRGSLPRECPAAVDWFDV
jgi:hypothetical protein